MTDHLAEITLKCPIQAHGETVAVLKLRQPKGRDVRRIDTSKLTHLFDVALDLASELAAVPPSSLDELDVDDVAAVAGAVIPFLERFLGTGRTS